jgi:hypothetical protein
MEPAANAVTWQTSNSEGRPTMNATGIALSDDERDDLVTLLTFKRMLDDKKINAFTAIDVAASVRQKLRLPEANKFLYLVVDKDGNFCITRNEPWEVPEGAVVLSMDIAKSRKKAGLFRQNAPMKSSNQHAGNDKVRADEDISSQLSA